jgi:PII-like signaling protein
MILKTYHVMRVYVTEAEKVDGKPAWEFLLQRIEDRGLSGATVLRAMAGFGPHHVLHTEKILRLSDDLPLVVEVIRYT